MLSLLPHWTATGSKFVSKMEWKARLISRRTRVFGAFFPLKGLAYFRMLRVDPDLGTIVWPNGADLDPDVLYARVTGQPIEVDAARR
jgi:hypothetical protein